MSARAGLGLAVGALVAQVAAAGWLLQGAMNHMGAEEQVRPGQWMGTDFAIAGWICLGVVLASTVLAWRKRDEAVLPLLAVGIGGQVAFAAGVVTLSLAVAAERQNYWDAYHFAVIVWTFVLSASVALAANLLAARRGSALAAGLLGLSSFWVFVSLFALVWTWFPPAQHLEGWLSTKFFLATHG